ncbi:3-deoxy-D-manno-octulosonic acid transferase [Sagittula sp. SSi028]|uniref:3-deoxy-D-manno-octulosonic acid transferase n=1 Tax=Sagittula sp. SSi028 TaxID=3400636 RepID=UPI003AF6A5E7
MLLYRCLLSLFALLVVFRHGRARLRVPQPSGGQGGHIWLHGASNGELSSFRPVLERLVAARPKQRWLVTTNSDTGCRMVAEWGLHGVEAHVAPVDLAWVTRRVMRDWRVTAHLTLEAELWPHRILSCPGPVMVIGARMSEGTARGWGKLPGLARRILGRLAFVSAQDQGSADRLRALGASAQAMGPVVDLKAFYTPPQVTPVAGLDRSATWLAASTHAGEEETVLSAQLIAKLEEPDLRLVLAPRHPRRADDIRRQIEAAGLSVGQRSRGDDPTVGEVYLADTMGEMALWYASCGRVFIGGTLTDRGGHTPYEPAAFGAALLHGGDVRNFRAAFGRLRAAGASVDITDAEDLARGLLDLQSSRRQSVVGAAAQAALHTDVSPDALCQQILTHLPNA